MDADRTYGLHISAFLRLFRLIVNNADEVELLPPWLKVKMLCANDERIVNVALSDMKQEDALRFVQSFGLTSYSCSKLFAILDTITSLEGDVLYEARKAARFIRAYKLRGAVGADKFLARLSERQSQSTLGKMEVDDEDAIQIVQKDPPRFGDIYQRKETPIPSITVEEAIHCIDVVS
uniref:ORC4_C domain-containing protein n=1 Tax=Ascaris lumbricoides TaxID=6252 RepID=A0A0M3HHC0_ASCLU